MSNTGSFDEVFLKVKEVENENVEELTKLKEKLENDVINCREKASKEKKEKQESFNLKMNEIYEAEKSKILNDISKKREILAKDIAELKDLYSKNKSKAIDYLLNELTH